MDLTTTWSWRNTTSPISLIRKNTGSETPPNLSRGAFYAGPSNGTKLYTYGGTVDSSLNSSWDGFQRPTSNQYALWSYDLNNGNWAHENTTSDTTLIRPASGASAEASELGLGFWFNGEQDNGTSSESNDLWNTVKFLKGMIVLDFNTGEAKNISTAAVSDLARTRGEMVYIPGVGQSGILVLMGGGEKGADYEDSQEYGTLVGLCLLYGPLGRLYLLHKGKAYCEGDVQVSMAQVEIFDVASLYNQSTPNGTWYSQRATGDIPNARVDFCLVVASAPDGSSHNIYMHGGRGTSGDYYDDSKFIKLTTIHFKQLTTHSS